MANVAFDTLAYSDRLQKSGIPREQADAMAHANAAAFAEAFKDIVIAQQLATKQDIAEVKREIADVKQDIAEVKREIADVKQDVAEVKREIADVKQEFTEVKREIADTKQEMTEKIADTKHEILKWMVTAMLAQTALLVGIFAFLK